MFDYSLPVQIPYILNLTKLHVNVDVTELLPDATHCFYNLARSWFWLEKSDLKHKQCLKLLFDSQVRHSCINRTLFTFQQRNAKCTVHEAALTCITVALFGVVALSREATRMPLPDLLFFPLFLQNELPQTRLDLHRTHTYSSQCIHISL